MHQFSRICIFQSMKNGVSVITCGDEEPNVQPGVLDCRWNRQHQWLEKWPASLWAEAVPSVPPGEDKPGTLQWQFSSNAFPTTPHLVGKAFIFPQLDLSFHQICSQLAKRVAHKLAGILCLVSWQEGEVCYNWVPQLFFYLAMSSGLLFPVILFLWEPVVFFLYTKWM